MAEHLAYQTRKRKTEPLEFSIDGDDYTFSPPKQADLILPVLDADDDVAEIAVVKSQYDWFAAGLGADQWERLLGRLRDPKDSFDSGDVDNLLKWVMKQVNGRPTG